MTSRRIRLSLLAIAATAFVLVVLYAATPRTVSPATNPSRAGLEVATFAAGCFWCTEADFDKVKGVVATTSGYAGGHRAKPSYQQVSSGGTGHVESVQVLYDPSVVSYEQLLEQYWSHVDPFVMNQQFCDAGEQYSPEIFVATAQERAAAEASRARIEQRFGRPVAVRIRDEGAFYKAEDEHQDYAREHPIAYGLYRWSCGRDARVASLQAAH